MQCGAGPEGSAPFAQRSRGNLIHVVAVPVRPGLPARDCGASCSSDDFGGGWLCSHDGNRTPCSVGQLSGGTSREKVIHCAVQPTSHHNHAGGTLCGAVGHDVRIGLEGTLVLGDGTRARDSAVLVPAAHAMAVAAAASSSRADASSGVRRAGMPH